MLKQISLLADFSLDKQVWVIVIRVELNATVWLKAEKVWDERVGK